MSAEISDHELLCRYAEKRDQAAFAEWVRRQVDFVYGCALRRVNGDVHLAHDVTQEVFCAAARGARELARHDAPGGWLYTTVKFSAAHVVRSEQRRRVREQQAFAMNENAEPGTPDWDRVRPVLDETIDALDERDRTAVVLRFFEGRSFAVIGGQLRLTENAARMRVERALEKLHRSLARRGIRSSAAALGVLLTENAVAVAPAGLAASAASAAFGMAVAGATTTGFMSILTWQVGVAGSMALVAGGGWIAESRTTSALQDELKQLRQQTAVIETLQRENLQLGRAAVEVAQWQRSDAELEQLGREAGVLRTQLQQVAAAEARANAQRVYDLAMLDQTPVPTFQARPQYPAALREKGEAGEVVVEFLVDQSGLVQQARAIRSTAVEFENPAVEAVSTWRFRAGRKEGQEVVTRLQVPIVFTLAGKEARRLSEVPASPKREAFQVEAK